MVDESGRHYLFTLVTKTLKVVEFEANFNGSDNCTFIEVKAAKQNAKGDSGHKE